MKKRISFLTFVCCCSLLLVAITGCSSREMETGGGEGVAAGTTQNDVMGTAFTKVATDGDTVLSINKDTGSLMLENRAEGVRCVSNPEEAVIDLERAQFFLTYLDKKGITATMNTYSDSVKSGQYKIENIKNGVKVTFTCGEYLEELLFPSAITPEDFEALTEKIEDNFEKLYVTSRYKLTDIEKVTAQTEKEALLEKFPKLATQKLYILKQDNPNVSVRRELHRLFTSVGYDRVAYDRDMKLMASVVQQGDPFFTFSVYYTLEKGNLRVWIPADEIVEANGGKLLELAVLPYMDSPTAEISGQFLLPDGSGSLMNFRNGKPGSGYEVKVYGDDLTNQAKSKPVNVLPCYLPVVGCLREDHTLLTHVTGGAAIATVRAVSGGADTLPQAYFEYATRPYVRTKLSSDGAADGFTTVARELYEGDIVQEYSLYKKGTTYSDLAAVMRERLFGEGKEEFTASPLTLNFVGTAKEEKSLFGIKYQKKAVYSTVERVAVIREALLSTVPQLTVRLSGFVNGGMEQQLHKGITVEGGSIEDLQALLAHERCYLSFDLLLLRTDGLFDQFWPGRDSAYTLQNLRATYKEYNPATSAIDHKKSRYILSGNALQKAFDQLLKNADALEFAGLAVNDGASLLGVDYSRKQPTNRQGMADVVSDGLAALADSASVMVDGANDYALGYASALANVHLTSTKFDICDESVPFLPMVICGNVDYFGLSMNTVNNDLTSFLQVIESGAGLYYTVTTDEEKNFSKTEFDEYFSTKFSVWEDEIVDRTEEIQKLFAKRGRTMIRHEKLAEGVYKTVYDNGFYTIVNYGTDAFEQEGIIVPALGYVTGGVS